MSTARLTDVVAPSRSARPQTSVRISPVARDALGEVAGAWGISRDAAVRRLLADYLRVQGALPEERRLTHISTLLRYPPLPVFRGDPDGRIRLAFRLDAGVADTASAMAFRLPGQADRQAHRDYGGRPLTDALLTSLASEVAYEESGLEGLPVLITHREARGIWRLTIAATASRAEERVLRGDPDGDLAFVLREEGVGWHSRWRFAVARAIARRILIGPDPEHVRPLLWEQGEAFIRLEWDIPNDTQPDAHWLLRDLPAPTEPIQGRGGAAVWRARRKLALTAIENWLTSEPVSDTLDVAPPEWSLEMPSHWITYGFRHGDKLPAAMLDDLKSRRVLRIDAGATSALWPYTLKGPVPGFPSVLDGLPDRLSPAEVVETVLVETPGGMRVPADTAWQLGLIPKAERDDLIQNAVLANDAEVRDVLRRASRRSNRDQAALRAAASDHARFARVARRLRLRCKIRPPVWTWEIYSIRHALTAGTRSDRLEWLAGEGRRMAERELERDMERAAMEAFRLGQTSV